ncbi:MAG TPA: T9SS type A sorting domain-containing protein [Candidatus Acidoferrales bacterium]|nr:T9SS type A sorting domain-containing protein [Candidatus Acidoferrales bacterium]
MKRVILPVLFAVIAWSSAAYAQETMIDSLSNIAADSNFVWAANVEGGHSSFVWAQDAVDKPTGFAASLDIKTKIDSLHAWGSFSQLIYRLPTGHYMDFSSSDTLRLWVKIIKAPLFPQYMSFRIQLVDQDNAGDPLETFIYQNDSVLDVVKGWYQLKIPLHEINSQSGTVAPGDSGFVEAPYNWGGFTWNNHKLDIANIVGWNIVMVTTTTTLTPNPPTGYTNVPLDSIEVKYAGFDRTGNRPVPITFFNGLGLPNSESTFTWGGSTFSLETGNGPVANTNSLHWVTASGWNGAGFNIGPLAGASAGGPFHMSGGWPVDSLKFMYKSDAGADTVRVQFESRLNGTSTVSKVSTKFQPNGDGQWHQFIYPLRNFVPQDGTTGFNADSVLVLQFICENGAGVAGKNIYISNIWTGNPPHPVPPIAPTGIAVVTKSNYSNIISWNDVPGQTGETYNVYFSTSPITNIDSSIVDVAATGVAHGTDSYTHLLLAPLADQSVTYYYAVVCRSSDGLLGTPAVYSAAVTNTAKGIPSISPLWKLSSQFNFAADGDISEWKNAGIEPFRLYVSDGSGTPVTGSIISSDTVSSGDIYVAMDKTYLYIAGHINTNNIVFNSSQSSWLNTSTDIFLGFYNWHGMPHSALEGGPEPDYHFRFAEDRVIIDNKGTDSLVTPGQNYYWGQRLVPDPLDGYNFEARISWTDIAHKRNGGYSGTDSVFAPQVGARIPFDAEINSVSSGNTSRNGQLDYSSLAHGNSYQNVAVWSYTWIGDKMTLGVKQGGQIPNTYSLLQNYPNPFNPTTTIQYSIMKPGLVTLTVYNVLGQKVVTLVNAIQTAGSHAVILDASKLSTGVYFYRIKSGSFENVKKMLLLK